MDHLTILVKTVHLIYLLSEHKCNKAAVKCVLTESRLTLRVFSRRRQSRATYQSANIYDAFIFSCNYEHLFWAPIMSTCLRQWTVFTYFRLQANVLALNTIYILRHGYINPAQVLTFVFTFQLWSGRGWGQEQAESSECQRGAGPASRGAWPAPASSQHHPSGRGAQSQGDQSAISEIKLAQ